MPGAIVLVTNELDRADVSSYGLDVRMVRFESDAYPIGFNDVALRRNVGIWATSASHVLTFDDDQVAPPGLIESARQVLERAPVCWGHYRFIDFDAFTFEDLLVMPPEAGRARETPPNAWHSSRSAYAGLFSAERALVQRAGGFDMSFSGRHGGEDQDLARRLSLMVRGDDAIYVHEPPFAWHPEQAAAWEEPRYSNLCRGDHSVAVRQTRGVTVHACSRCPFYWVPQVESTTVGAQMPFEAAKVRMTVSHLSRSMRTGRFAAAFPFIHGAIVERIADELGAAHDDYVARMSSLDMAISRQVAALLWALCDGLKPRRALDLGAGFGSFVLRLCGASGGVDVWTVDDETESLERTRQFVASHGLPEGRFTSWRECSFGAAGTFDLVFYDLGSMAARARRLPDVMNLVADRGVLVLDDMHKEEYAPAVEKTLGGDRWQFLDPRPLSLDRFGRFCGVVVRALA